MKAIVKFLGGMVLGLSLVLSVSAQQFDKLLPHRLGESIVLDYAISGESAGQTFTVSPFYSTDGGRTFKPLRSVKGNVGSHVPGGRNLVVVWNVLRDLPEFDSDVVFKLEASSSKVVALREEFKKVDFRLKSLNRNDKGEVELHLSIKNNGPKRELKIINGLVTLTDFNKRKYDAHRGRIAEVEGNERYSTPTRILEQGEEVDALFTFGWVPADIDRAMRLDIGVELITDEGYGIDLKIGRLQFRDLPISVSQTAGITVKRNSRFKLISQQVHFTVRKQVPIDSLPPLITLVQPANVPLVGNEATRGRPYAQSSIGMDDKRLRSLATGEAFATTDQSIHLIGKVTDKSDIYQVAVNGYQAALNTDGRFEVDVPLQVGKNEIIIRAVDVHKNSTERKFFVRRKLSSGKVAKGETEELDIIFDKPRSKPRYYALIMAANDYQDSTIADLEQPIKDASRLYKALVTHYTFEPENVIFLKNPTREKMIDALDFLTRRITKNDNLLVFYAGHGFWDEDTDFGYWIPTDSKANSTAYWLANSQIKDYVAAIKSKHTLLIADACFGGSIFHSRKAFSEGSVTPKKAFDARSRKAMTSGNLTEVPDKSVFLDQLVNRLNTNTKNYITAEELFASIKDIVITSSPVTPVYGEIKDAGDEGGDFLFVRK